MLVLSKLHSIVSRVLAAPDIHTAVLLTIPGELVAYAAEPDRPKDEIRVITGLASEVWQETREQGYGMVDSEKYGKILVLPVDEFLAGEEQEPSDGPDEYRQPLMLLALNALESVDWDDLQERGIPFADQLAKPLKRFRPFLKVTSLPPPSAALSPTPR